MQLFFVFSPSPLLTVDGLGSIAPVQFNSKLIFPSNSTVTSLNLILLAVDFVIILL